MECAICLQKCIHPVRLACDHIFCFLCVKGAAFQTKKCAMCRREIPENYFDNPQLIEQINEKELPVYDDEFQWYYEGKNGWWLYDQRTSDDIESAYKNNNDQCEVLIAGFVYVVDFKNMVQYRRNEPNRMRKIKRDHSHDISTKGIAGLKKPSLIEQSHQPHNNNHNNHNNNHNNVDNSLQNINQQSVNSLSRSLLESLIAQDTQDESDLDNNHDTSDQPDDSFVNNYSPELIDNLEEMLSAQLTLDETRETYL